MGNTCTNCSQCKGDASDGTEVLTVDNKVSGVESSRKVTLHISCTLSHTIFSTAEHSPLSSWLTTSATST